MTLLVTLIEDEAHKNFLSQCGQIVSDLNNECSIGLRFEFRAVNCHGMHELVINVLPSYLAFPTERYLLVLDLDDKNEYSLREWIVDHIKHARTKQFSHAIRVESKRDNVISVVINNKRKKIVILPLGLNKKLLPNIRIHSVEDYCLVQVSRKLKAKRGDNSKMIIKDLIRDEKINEQEIQMNTEKSINDCSDVLSKYLRPLWDPI